MPRPCHRYCLSLATAVVLLLASSASALAKSYAIEVETDPTGAKVYLDDKDGKLLGKTPYRGKLAKGTYTLFIIKRGYEPMYQSIEVKKKSGGRQEFYFALEEVEYGRVKIVAAEDAEDIDDARILIDGDEVGNAPDTIDKIAVGPHQVEIIKEGYEIFEAWIEVEQGETVTVEVELEEDPDAVYGGDDDDDDGDDDDDDGDDDDDDDDGDDDDDDDDGDDDDDDDDDDGDDDDDDDDDGDDDDDLSAGLASETNSSPYIIVALGPEVGNRNFAYVVPAGVTDAPNVRPYDAALVPLLRVRAQVYPLAGSGSPALAGWGFSGSYAQAKGVTSQTGDNQSLDTSWNEWDANLRFQLRLGKAAIGTEVGYAGQTFDFTASDATGTLIEEVPAVDYRFTRVGVDGGFAVSSKINIWIGGNYRIVSALGALGTRFLETQVTAYGGQAGLNYSITRSIQAQLLLNLARYEHLFIIRRDGDMAQAAGTDQFLGAMLGIAYLR